MPNVIVVAGLDRNMKAPDLEKASTGKLLSDYGSRVHVGAIGADVFSTIAYGRYGTMSGSSFAAPQVAAVASLMMKKYKTLTPQEVKNRLIYCSDHVGKLGVKIFGGRLNADCALDGDKGRLVLATSAGAVKRGYFTAYSTLTFQDQESGRAIQLPIKVVRAIHYDATRKVHTVYFNADTKPDSRLLRETKLVPVPNDETVDFVDDATGTPYPIPVRDIVRYTSAAKSN
jgi:subtilisin family serine protease